MFDCRNDCFFYLCILLALGVGGTISQTVGSVRLIGGTSPLEGRVEVYYHDQWGTICDDHWDLREAAVVCRQLGYKSVASEHTKFGAGSGHVLLDDVHCSGGEILLVYCPHVGWAYQDCTHAEDVGVVCSNSTDTGDILNFPDEITYRLYGGSYAGAGVLQFRSTPSETWNTVCSPWPIVYAGVGADICQQVGYKVFCSSSALAALPDFTLPDELNYSPMKEAGLSCSFQGDWGCVLETDALTTRTCDLSGALWIVCDSDLDVRLSHGLFENTGVLEVRCRNSQQWYGVCGDYWQYYTGAHRVACRHSGFPHTADVHSYALPASYLRVSMSILMTSVACSGDETTLVDCWLRQPVFEGCNSYAGLKCGNEAQPLELRLVHSKFEGSGVVQGRRGMTDEWGAVCGTHWDDRDAEVVCRHLGFLTSIFVTKSYRDVFSPAFLTAIGCYGYETALSQCELVHEDRASCSTVAYVECIAETTRYNDSAYVCGEIHYCGYDCNQGPRDTHRPIEQETCKCDDACLFFSDCCYDYRSNCLPASDLREVQMNGKDIGYYTCLQVWGKERQSRYRYFGFALVSVCPEQWTGTVVRQNCEATAGSDDVIGSLPVYDEEGAVYKNIFCAVCHGVQPERLNKWSANFEYIPSGHTTLVSRLNVTIEGTPTGRYVFEPPGGSGKIGAARTCPVKTVGSCPEKFANSSLEAACLGYFAPLDVNQTHFMNPHCALCNGLPVKPSDTCGMLCTPLCTGDSWAPCSAMCGLENDLPSIEALFDFGWGGDENSPCQQGELLDPFSGRCRTVLCVSGIANEDGACAEDYRSQLGPPSSQYFSLLDETCTAFVIESLHPDVFYWQAIPCVGNRSLLNTSHGDFSLAVIFKNWEAIDELENGLFDILDNRISEITRCSITSVTVYVHEGASLLSKIGGCTHVTTEAKDVFHSASGNITVLDFTVLRQLVWTIDNSSCTRQIVAPSECLDVFALNCTEIVLLGADEYMFTGATRSFKHISTRHEFTSEEFVILPDDSAVVCSFSLVTTSYIDEFAMGLVSLVCSCMSLLMLAGTLVTYCIFPELRNMPGMYTMNLVVALFVAMLLFVLTGKLKLQGHVCTASAALMHLSWLAAFFWMGTLSLNAARVFCRRTVLPTTAPPSYRRLFVSMGFVWGGALLIVVLCLVVNYCNCTALQSIYSELPPCWIVGGDVLLVVFGVPVATSLLINTICFIVIILKVRRTRSDSKMVQKRGQIKEVVEEVKIYAKLTLLFGITWLLAFASEIINHVALSYVNVIINTSQGVFIFIAFCLSQRVRALWRKKLASADRRAGGRTSSSIVASVSQNATCSTAVNSRSEQGEQNTHL